VAPLMVVLNCTTMSDVAATSRALAAGILEMMVRPLTADTGACNVKNVGNSIKISRILIINLLKQIFLLLFGFIGISFIPPLQIRLNIRESILVLHTPSVATMDSGYRSNTRQYQHPSIMCFIFPDTDCLH